MKALLARPHDFIVDDMRRWLAALGLQPVRLSTLADLEQHAPADVRALVISTAVTSSVKATVAEALAAVRRRFAGTPLLLAGLASVASARVGLEAELRAHGLALHGAREPAAWGTPRVALYVQDMELRPGRTEALTAAARRHLRLL
ncbi:MAG: hypothetical protein AB1730_04675 [Myxococcota bacterium]